MLGSRKGAEVAGAAFEAEAPPETFEALLEGHRKILFKVAGMYCRDEEDRRDLVQEMSAQLWRSFGRYDRRRPFSTWMYRVALNVAISSARSALLRRRHHVPLEEGAVEPVDESAAREPDERVGQLQRFIGQLDELERALLLLYLEEHSYRQIADVLGMTETNVATRISRLKRRIRDDLAASQASK